MRQAIGSKDPTDLGPRELIGLASRPDLSPRVRGLLDGVFALFSRRLGRSLATVLYELELNLVRQAGKSRAGASGEQCLDSVGKLKNAHADMARRLLLSLENGLARLDQPAVASAVKVAPSAPALSELALVESTDLDESLALQDIAAKAEARNSLPLYELGHRFAVLVARPAFNAETLPLGPSWICAGLRHAVADLTLPLAHRVQFYQTFDRLAMSEIGGLYAAANAYFVEQRILRHLQAHTAPAKGRTAAPPASAEPTADSSSAATLARPASVRPGATPSATGREAASSLGLAAFETVSTAARTRPATARETPPPAPAELHGDEQFKPLRRWLAARRCALGIEVPAKTADAYEPTARELQSALSVLQVRSPTTSMLNGTQVQRTLAQLRQDLLNQLRQVTPAGQMLRLGDEDTDTIELLGLLFDELLDATGSSGRTASLLTLLQVPLLRAALDNKEFFLRADHPARRLLNTVAEIGLYWSEDAGGVSNSSLIERTQRAVERVNREFESDLLLLEKINTELHTQLQSLARTADVAERRLVEAARGREKLALARKTATRAIALRLAVAKPSRLLRTLLEQAWTDVLTLTVLRQGEKSETYKRQLEVVGELIARHEAPQDENTQPLAARWREEIETGLSQVGYHDDDVQAVVDRMFAPGRADADDNAFSQTDLALRLKNKTRFGESPADPVPISGTRPEQAALPLNAEETGMLERLKRMPAGACFESTSDATGHCSRLKLSWFSAQTGRCLLVDQQGARIDSYGLEQLARDLVAGRKRLFSPGREPLAERCWDAVVAALKQFGGSTPP